MEQQNPVKILRIITRLNVGGPAIQAINLAKDLGEGKFRTILVSGQVGINEEDMSYLAEEKKITPIIIPELGREISAFDDVKAVLSIRRLIREYRPDIVHTHTAKAGALGRLAAIIVNLASRPKKKIKIVHTFHGHVFHSYFNRYKTRIFIIIEKILAIFSDRVIVISVSQSRDICRRFRVVKKKKVSIVPLGFDLSRFKINKKNGSLIRKKYFNEMDDGFFLLGIVGRLVEIKNHSLLFRALRLINDMDKVSQLKCIIVGDGELKQDLVKEASELGLSNTVIFAGWQKDMPAFYQAFDAVVLTSKNEGTPVSIIEAMASGTPVASTDVGGVRDLFGRIDRKTISNFDIAENGILTRPGNPESLANAILFLMHEREKTERMVENARNFVQRKYSFARLSDDIKSLYMELMN